MNYNNSPQEPKKQYYLLTLYLPCDVELAIGRLGSNILFPKGYYVYVGRAKKNIEARLARHCRKEKNKRWHIDYLTTVADVTETVTLGPEEGPECKLACKLKEAGGKIILKGFGSSDCRCPSHLIYFTSKPCLKKLAGGF